MDPTERDRLVLDGGDLSNGDHLEPLEWAVVDLMAPLLDDADKERAVMRAVREAITTRRNLLEDL
jgi:hypothetical protein